MALKLYGHPFSSYTQKALIALYENGTAFDYLTLGPDAPEIGAEFGALWPIGKFPVLVDEGQLVFEATIIVEHLGLHHPGPVRLLPADPAAALPVRMLDRFFDNYVMRPMQKIVTDSMRSGEERDARGVADSRALLDTAYAWLEKHLEGREWAADGGFTLADCAAAPSLFYADWAHPIPDGRPHLRAYRQRLLERPSFARAVDEARPYRPFFPLGAPDRD
ncbi:MAG TPA: glutathione S-transferase family protein [Allosphingosinicella sp.]|jgi:glutathione S-transferase